MELKPCPFCGSKAELRYSLNDNEPYGVKCYYYRCSNKKCDLYEIWSRFRKRSKKKAIKIWNTRPESAWEKAWNELKHEIELLGYVHMLSVFSDIETAKEVIEDIKNKMQKIEKELKNER